MNPLMRQSIIIYIKLLLIVYIMQFYDLNAQNFYFGQSVNCGILTSQTINEVSGLVSSIRNPDILWTHNDSGDKNRLFALNRNATHLGTYYLVGCEAQDWEDLAIGPGPRDGIPYLYVGDIGDNHQNRHIKTIYRIPEPFVSNSQEPAQFEVHGAEKIIVMYPNDQMVDAETILLDPLTKDLYLITKSESMTTLYRAAYPQPTSIPIQLERQIVLSMKEIVGGDISQDGSEILLKNYLAVFYWKRLPGESISQTLQRKFNLLPYFPEPQGEAICWKSDGSGYFTLSEKKKSIETILYFYPRLNDQ